MTAADLDEVERVGDRVHPDYPETAAVFGERLQRYPAGCLVFQGPGSILGYTISHPWRLGQPPKLNVVLGSLPERPDTFYIHDVALLPEARGSGAGGAAVALLTRQAVASGLGNMSLVAVSGASGFWRRHGFDVLETPEIRAKLAEYGESSRFMVRWLR
ncbi:GNAT family N-acetyltransferase [Rhodovastum atsumiense]|uniref:GNAT family N-acetyltransferase n=2 Tax=Rhodovastum atsumiense TaxID=504468 RepID=A0A5M6IW92_9PROT|nr:GNAT family N-acetyltransferase [Rhodovastum atsumiense]